MCFVFPKYIDRFIFGTMGGHYRPDPDRAKQTRTWGVRELQDYLGTYWPRSFAESCRIFDILISQGGWQPGFDQAGTCSVLDIGSGTGANLSGLVYTLTQQSMLDSRQSLQVDYYESNRSAVDIFNKVTAALCHPHIGQQQNLCDDTLRPGLQNTLEHLQGALAQGGRKYDIIMSFKFVNEFCRGDDIPLQPYADLVRVLRPWLRRGGVMVILDVPDKCGTPGNKGPFLSIKMNSEITGLCQCQEMHLRTIFPVSCRAFGQECRSRNCFTQMVTEVSHSGIRRDGRKSSVRVLVDADDVALFLAPDPARRTYCINEARRSICREGQFVFDAEEGDYPSAFRIENQ